MTAIDAATRVWRLRDGLPVLYCNDECLSHRCTNPCGRLAGHGDDFHGCICDDCASAVAGWF